MNKLNDSMRSMAGVAEELSNAFGSLFEVEDLERVATFYSMPVMISDAAIEIDKARYLSGIIPLPRHLKAWHVARRYKELSNE